MISRNPRRLVIASVAALAVTASLGSAAVAAGPGDRQGSRAAASPVEGTAVGLIVRTERTTASATDVSRIAKAASVDTDSVERKAAGPGRGGKVLVQFDEPLQADDAVQAAAEVSDQPGVASAEPNWLLTVSKAAPVATNDPFFTQLVGIWDDRDADDVGADEQWEDGGFSVHAPELWRATRGSDKVRVAVIDTGYTSHPDLDGNRVKGYDFLSDASQGDPEKRDSDSDYNDLQRAGWDDDASDPGDWTDITTCPLAPGSPPPTQGTDSSWHGTHVAGTVAAVDDNKQGVAGVAPNVKFQPIRALGPCGGSLDDIATAIRWASGATDTGAPINPTPAQVINLSLGGAAGEPCGRTLREAVKDARANGSVVVAAAGNESTDEQYAALSAPANCDGVVAVTAIDDYGQVTSYSNVGTDARSADISAPGGSVPDSDPDSPYSQILSTVNLGATTPAGSGYARYVGTSMAAPHVAGGAALLASSGYSREEIESALIKAVRPYPVYGDAFDCVSSAEQTDPDGVDCGRGILDLGLVPAFYGSKSLSGTAKSGKTLTLPTEVTGKRENEFSRATVTYVWKRNGSTIRGATSKSYKLTSSDKGKKITAQLTVSRPGFKTISFTSPSRTVSR